MSGVTYYKLEQRYEGDRTKGCGLTSAEVDANFHFLRGYDIKDVTLSDDGVLTFHHVNCDYDFVITNLPDIIQEITDNAIASSEKPFNLTGEYDETTGELTLKLNGAELVVPGFDKTDFDFKLHVGQGLEGDGTKNNPIRLSLVNQTGFFAPVDAVYDEENGEEPDNKAKRYITRELVSPYGLLYSYEAAKSIDEYLELHGNGWRIPTEEDWDNLLSFVECDGANANRLKNPLSFDDDSEPNFFNALYTFKERAGGEDKKHTLFWVATIPECADGYVAKDFIQYDDLVEPVGFDRREKSIRLVKDASLPHSDAEVILGRTYSTTAAFGSLIWTVDNLGVDNEEIIGVGNSYSTPLTDDEYAASSVWKYFINEKDADGTLSKKELPANSVVMIHDYSGRTDEEWVVREENGEFSLVSRNDIIQEYIDSGIGKDVAILTEITDAHQKLIETLSSSAETLESGLNETNENLSTLEERVNGHDDRIENIEERLDGAGSDTSSLAERVGALEANTAQTKNEIDELSDVTRDVLSAITRSDENFETIFDNMVTDVVVNGERIEPQKDNGHNVVSFDIPVTSIQNDDPILSLENNVLKSKFRVSYNEDNNVIEFYGQDDTDPMAILNAKRFVVDGFLSKVETGYTQDTGEPVLIFTFNTDLGEKQITVRLKDLVTEYTVARGSDNYLDITGFEIAFKPDGLSNQYASTAISNDIRAVDEKVGEANFVDKDGHKMSVSHKIVEIEDKLNDYIDEENYTFSEDFTVAGLLGTLGTGFYNKEQNRTIPAGTSVMEVLKHILRAELEPKTVLPSATIEFQNDGEYMEGDNVSLEYRIALDPGKYTYDDGTSASTQMSVRSYVVTLYKWDGDRRTTVTSITSNSFVPTGEFSGIELTPGSKYMLSLALTYDSDYTPTTNFGEERPDAKITANGNVIVADSETSIEVYRPIRYAILLSDNDIAYDYDNRTVEFSGNIKNISGIPNVTNIVIEEGAQAIALLIPRMEQYQSADIYSIDKILDLGTGLELKDTFYENKWTAEIDGYKHSAYVYDPAIGLNETTYRLRISKNS